MTNPQRGEAALHHDGAGHVLRLTLGALAEIEERLGAHGFDALGERLSGMNAGDLAAVLGALLRAGGAQDADAIAAAAEPRAAARAVAEVFTRSVRER